MWPRRYFPSGMFAPRYFPDRGVSEEIGGTVCGTLTLIPRINGTLEMLHRCSGELSNSPNVNGTVSIERC